MTKKVEYKVEIDFKYAEEMWRKNKIQFRPGMFKYVCGQITARHQKCQNKPLGGIIGKPCYRHSLK